MNTGKPHPPTSHGEYRRAGDKPARVRTKSSSLDGYPNWLHHPPKHGGRHSAITRNLYNWTSYKSWAEKVRSSWDAEK